MKKASWLKLSALSLALGLTACGGTPEKEAVQAPQYPSWIDAPVVADGIAESACVTNSGNMTLDKKRSIANARAMIAQSIETRIKAMDKTYQRVTETESEMSSGSSFESVSKQVTEQNLRGTKMLKGGYFTINDKRQYCAMVGFGQQETRAVFEDALKAADAQLSPTGERAMYEEFRAFKAQEELERALAN